MTSEGQSDLTSPLGDQAVHITTAHKLFPRSGRFGSEDGQVQTLGELLEARGKPAVVDEPVLVHVELSEQSPDVVLRDAELATHRSKVLELDATRFVHIAGGEESPETRPLHREMNSSHTWRDYVFPDKKKRRGGDRFLCSPKTRVSKRGAHWSGPDGGRV